MLTTIGLPFENEESENKQIEMSSRLTCIVEKSLVIRPDGKRVDILFCLLSVLFVSPLFSLFFGWNFKQCFRPTPRE
jgi:hypothetical protein